MALETQPMNRRKQFNHAENWITGLLLLALIALEAYRQEFQMVLLFSGIGLLFFIMILLRKRD